MCSSSESGLLPPLNFAFLWQKAELHELARYAEHIASLQAVYPSLVEAAVQALLASRLAYKSAEEAKIHFERDGWSLVASVQSKNAHLFGLVLKHVHLVRNSSPHCILAFMGTQFVRHWLRYSMPSVLRPMEIWCGIPGVHTGFIRALVNLAKEASYQNEMKPELRRCKTVEATGHSLGGAGAALFEACVNEKLAEAAEGYSDDVILAGDRNCE